MSFQAYLDNIRAKTGKPPGDIAAMVVARGLSKPAEIIAWLKAEFGLGHGHSMAIVSLVRRGDEPSPSADAKIAAYFSGSRSRWRPAFERLVDQALRFGPDVAVSPGKTYLSLVKGGHKFAIVQAVGDRMDVGLKLGDVPAAGRLEPAGSWNSMVTHRVRIAAEAELDDAVLGWLQQAYVKAGL